MYPRRRFHNLSSLPLLLISAAVAQQPKQTPRYEIVDGHCHFLSFVQETAGMDAFFKAMDETGVVESIVIGMPLGY
jgi:hypothetical protein